MSLYKMRKYFAVSPVRLSSSPKDRELVSISKLAAGNIPERTPDPEYTGPIYFLIWPKRQMRGLEYGKSTSPSESLDI